jgi:predicted HicB family RNase H-like nuclease
MKPYRGYVGVARVDTDAGVIRSKVVNARDTITFQGRTVPEAEQAFHDSVDDYLAFCAEQGIEPERPFSGKFPVRTTPGLHRALSVAAGRRNLSINKLRGTNLDRGAAKAGTGDAPLTPTGPEPASSKKKKAPVPRGRGHRQVKKGLATARKTGAKTPR